MEHYSEANFKIILGLKVQQERAKKHLSLKDLGDRCGLSKSYLNEIEKGKKYPKPDKLMVIAQALDVEFEYLVTPKLEGDLAQIYTLLNSPVLRELPLEYFGITSNNLVEFITKAPDRVRALLRTILDLGQHYNISKERFFFAVLQSYQELHLNYFEELEDWAAQQELVIESNALIQKLQQLGVHVEVGMPDQLQHPKLRSLFTKAQKLFIKEGLTENQMHFILLKEYYYRTLNIKARPLSFPWIYFDSFDQLMHNMRAGYAAGALLLPQKEVQKELLENFFRPKTKSLEGFVNWISTHPLGVETVMQRLTNILPAVFGLKELFFLRIGVTHLGKPTITKQLHLLKEWNAYELNEQEDYCSKWLSIKALYTPHTSKVQISKYPNGTEYLIVSVPKNSQEQTTITLGILLNKKNRQLLKIHWSNLPAVHVGHTCQRCGYSDCAERKSPPVLLEKQKEQAELQALIQEFTLSTGA